MIRMFRVAAIAALPLVLLPGIAVADGDEFENCEKVFVDESYGPASFRETCFAEARRRRADLDAWGIDTAGMTVLEAWDRHGAETRKQEQARLAQAQRDQVEKERLAAERANAEAESQRIAAERDREGEKYAAAQRQAGQQMMEEQNAMLRGLGVNLGSSKSTGAACDDDEIDGTELSMYQTMLDNGVAPQCRGLTCGELIDCVDEALDEEED